MAPRKKPAQEDAAPVFDISQFREEKRYVWREIEREDGEPLRVKLEDLSIRQTNDIPWGVSITFRESMEVCAPYVVEWNHKAENIETGEVVDVPPPAEAGWQVIELLPSKVSSDLINWLKIPHYMKQEEAKKSQAASLNTSESSKETD